MTGIIWSCIGPNPEGAWAGVPRGSPSNRCLSNLEEPCNVRQRKRPGEQVTLRPRAAQAAQRRDLLLGLDALGDDLDAEPLAEHEDGLDDLDLAVVGGHRLYERAIDLERVDRQLVQVAERRIAGAEVVDSQLNAQRAQALEAVHGGHAAADEHALGELEA